MTGKPEQIPDEVVAEALKAFDAFEPQVYSQYYKGNLKTSWMDDKLLATGTVQEVNAVIDTLAMRAALSVYEAYRTRQTRKLFAGERVEVIESKTTSDIGRQTEIEYDAGGDMYRTGLGFLHRSQLLPIPAPKEATNGLD